MLSVHALYTTRQVCQELEKGHISRFPFSCIAYPFFYFAFLFFLPLFLFLVLFSAYAFPSLVLLFSFLALSLAVGEIIRLLDFRFTAVVRGFHVNHRVWLSRVGQRLSEHGNTDNLFAIALTENTVAPEPIKVSRPLVGHLLREFSKVVCSNVQ